SLAITSARSLSSWLMARAALVYAMHRNGFSPCNSSKVAISSKIAAISFLVMDVSARCSVEIKCPREVPAGIIILQTITTDADSGHLRRLGRQIDLPARVQHHFQGSDQ